MAKPTQTKKKLPWKEKTGLIVWPVCLSQTFLTHFHHSPLTYRLIGGRARILISPRQRSCSSPYGFLKVRQYMLPLAKSLA
jgi:hypothetical protein